jgi:hypothetical protein
VENEIEWVYSLWFVVCGLWFVVCGLWFVALEPIELIEPINQSTNQLIPNSTI